VLWRLVNKGSVPESAPQVGLHRPLNGDLALLCNMRPVQRVMVRKNVFMPIQVDLFGVCSFLACESLSKDLAVVEDAYSVNVKHKTFSLERILLDLRYILGGESSVESDF
jgi:hypothetical protein